MAGRVGFFYFSKSKKNDFSEGKTFLPCKKHSDFFGGSDRSPKGSEKICPKVDFFAGRYPPENQNSTSHLLFFLFRRVCFVKQSAEPPRRACPACFPPAFGRGLLSRPLAGSILDPRGVGHAMSAPLADSNPCRACPASLSLAGGRTSYVRPLPASL